MSYVAGEARWIFPGLGEATPDRSDAKVLLLTIGGICTVGHWDDSRFYTAWSPLPKRDKTKEAQLAQTLSRDHPRPA